MAQRSQDVHNKMLASKQHTNTHTHTLARTHAHTHSTHTVLRIHSFKGLMH
uniref:Uncharacterized protein n=1 Tax=Anguilla anguilla TaxID=7936 RepID=A0A0E9X767_ANGAN